MHSISTQRLRKSHFAGVPFYHFISSFVVVHVFNSAAFALTSMYSMYWNETHSSVMPFQSWSIPNPLILTWIVCLCVCVVISRAIAVLASEVVVIVFCCCYCLRLFALKIAQLLMQYKPTKLCNADSNRCYLLRAGGCTNEMANQHKDTIAFNAVKELKKIMITEKTLHKLACIVPMCHLLY